MKQAFIKCSLTPKDIVITYGVGCAANEADFDNVYGFHGLHGRGLPVAIGIKLANHKLNVLTVMGDGDCYGEGLNHLIAAARGNHDILALIHNNKLYALTTGQVSPTSDQGMIGKSTPHGVIETAFNPLASILVNGGTFVARGFADDINHLTNLITAGIKHTGFALIDILQPCISFNKVNTRQWYQSRIYKLEEENHNPSDFAQALKKSLQWGEKIPIGLFYQIQKPAYHQRLPQIKTKTLVSQRPKTDIKKFLKELT